MRGAQRLTGAARHASDDELATPVAPINRTLDAMLALEAWVMARGVNLPIGSSLMCLAQKPNHL